MFQWSLDKTLSLGLHIDPCTRTADNGIRFGPYADLHLLFMALSLGRNPAAAMNHSLIRPLWSANGYH